MNKHLRRLAPALAALVVGCNINESSSTEVASTSTGTISPRLAMVNGSTIPQVDSLLVQLSVEGSSYSQDLKVGWNDAVLQLKQIPLNKKWTLKIAGFMHADTVLANRDTAWYGEQTGTLTESTPQTKNATALAIGLKSAATTPAVAIGANAPGTTQKVGDVFSFTSESATQVVWTLDGSQPKCPDSLGTTKPLVLDADLASKTVTLKARTCTTGELPGRVAQYRFAVVAKDVALPPTIRIPTGFDSLGTATQDWKKSVSIPLPTGTHIYWNASVLSGSNSPIATDWANIPVPTDAKRSGVGSDIYLGSDIFPKLNPTDSLAQVLVKAALYDSTGKVVDTASMHWIAKIPLTPTIIATHRTTRGRAIFSWTPVSGTQTSGIWYWNGSSWQADAAHCSTDSSCTWSKDTSDGATVSVRLQAISNATNRLSDFGLDSVTTPRPPTRPKFSLATTDTTKGAIAVQLDAAIVPDKGTTWEVGYTADTTSATYEAGLLDTAGIWTGHLNQGIYRIAIRATRDGLVDTFSTIYHVVNTSGAHPRTPTLSLSARTSESVSWTWPQVLGRTYRVYKKTGSTAITKSDLTVSAASQDITVGAYTITGLNAGQGASIAVIALAGADSSASDADPAFSIVGFAKNPPTMPTFTPILANAQTGTLQVQIDNVNALDGQLIEVGYGSSSTDLTWSTQGTDGWSKILSAGTYYVSVRTTRDTLTATAATQSIAIKRTDDSIPPAPTELSFQQPTGDTSSVIFNWKGPAGATYSIQWKINPANNTDLNGANFKTKSSTSDTITGLAAGTPVLFSVQTTSATDASSSSLQPASRRVGTTSAASLPVTEVTWSQVGTHLNVEWTPPSGSTSILYKQTSAPSFIQAFSGVTSATFPVEPGNTFSFTIESYNGTILSKPATYTYYIPTNRGKTDAASWKHHLIGTSLVLDTVQLHYSEAPVTVNIGLRGAKPTQMSWQAFTQTLPTWTVNASGALTVQYAWANHDTTSTDEIPFDFVTPSLPQFKIRSGKGNDSLFAQSSVSIPSGWNGVCAAIDRSKSALAAVDLANTMFFPLGVAEMECKYVKGQDTSISVTGTLVRDSIMTDDRDKQTYRTVHVNGLTWMAEPLRYADSGSIGDNGDSSYTKGRFYTWSRATRISDFSSVTDWNGASGVDFNKATGVCMDGWHIPNQTEFTSSFSKPNSAPANADQYGYVMTAVGMKLTSSLIMSQGNFWVASAKNINFNGVQGVDFWATGGGSVALSSDKYMNVFCVKD